MAACLIAGACPVPAGMQDPLRRRDDTHIPQLFNEYMNTGAYRAQLPAIAGNIHNVHFG